jgi:hypothetical protein
MLISHHTTPLRVVMSVSCPISFSAQLRITSAPFLWGTPTSHVFNYPEEYGNIDYSILTRLGWNGIAEVGCGILRGLVHELSC